MMENTYFLLNYMLKAIKTITIFTNQFLIQMNFLSKQLLFLLPVSSS